MHKETTENKSTFKWNMETALAFCWNPKLGAFKCITGRMKAAKYHFQNWELFQFVGWLLVKTEVGALGTKGIKKQRGGIWTWMRWGDSHDGITTGEAGVQGTVVLNVYHPPEEWQPPLGPQIVTVFQSTPRWHHDGSTENTAQNRRFTSNMSL